MHEPVSLVVPILCVLATLAVVVWVYVVRPLQDDVAELRNELRRTVASNATVYEMAAEEIRDAVVSAVEAGIASRRTDTR